MSSKVERAITVRQPWAALLTHGLKQYETRPYRPRVVEVGDRIAIHAASQPALIPAGDTLDWIDNALVGKPEPLGVIVAVATLGGVYPTTGVGAPQVTPAERVFGDWSDRRWAWSLDVVRLADPIPCRGALGLWSIPDEVRAQLEQMNGSRPREPRNG